MNYNPTQPTAVGALLTRSLSRIGYGKSRGRGTTDRRKGDRGSPDGHRGLLKLARKQGTRRLLPGIINMLTYLLYEMH